MNALTRLVDLIARLAGGLAGVLAFVMVAIVLDGVFFRFVVNDPLQWTDEISVWSMVWMTWLAAIYAMRRWEHVQIPLFIRLFPVSARMLLVPLAKVLTLACLLVITWYGVKVFQGTFHSKSPSMGISTKWIKLSIPVGCGLMAVCALHLVLEDIGRILRGERKYFEDYGAIDIDEADASAAIAHSASGRVG